LDVFQNGSFAFFAFAVCVTYAATRQIDSITSSTMRVATILLLLLPAVCNAKAWQLLHSLDSGKTFTERGTVSLDLNEDGQVDIKLDHADNCLDLDAVNALSSAGLYQVKLVKDSVEILTSVPACHVRRANFRYVRMHACEWRIDSLFDFGS
jgi:hypothetical protein